MTLFTIGHSTAQLGELIDVLTANAVDIVIDVRSKPRSRLAHFDQYPLQEAIEQAGMRYRFSGDRLGGMPQDAAVRERWQQGRLDPLIVAHLRETDEWHDGLGELKRLLTASDSVCILCSEGDPDECHRKAIALDMAAQVPNLEVRHLTINKQAPTEIGVQEVLL